MNHQALPSLGPGSCSVLVPVRNEERWLGGAVAAMRAQQLDGELELLFADGGSTDRSREILADLAAEDGRIRVFDNPGQTTPSGLNVCLKHARGGHVARMDAHSFYPPDYLRLGIERLALGDTPWVSGPVIPQPTGRVGRALALALASPLGHGGARKWVKPGSGEVELDTGVFGGVWTRETVLACGGWDERWPQNQDAEMAARFLARGEKLVCLPVMGARYVPRDTLRGLARQYGRYGFYRVATARRHPGSLRRSHVLPPAVALCLGTAVVAPKALRRPARVGVALYGGALVREAGRAWNGGAPPGDALTLPLVLLAVHLGNGVGVLRGLTRFGVPVAALAHALGADGWARRLGPEGYVVHAPSLGQRCS